MTDPTPTVRRFLALLLVGAGLVACGGTATKEASVNHPDPTLAPAATSSASSSAAAPSGTDPQVAHLRTATFGTG